jgi:hypothetical protein
MWAVSREGQAAHHQAIEPDDPGRDPSRQPRDFQPEPDVAVRRRRPLSDEARPALTDIDQACRGIEEVRPLGPFERGLVLAGREAAGTPSFAEVHLRMLRVLWLVEVPVQPIVRDRRRIETWATSMSRWRVVSQENFMASPRALVGRARPEAKDSGPHARISRPS